MKVVHISIFTGVLSIISKSLKKNLDQLKVRVSLRIIQNSMVLETSHRVQSLWKALAQFSVNFVHQKAWDCYFKNSNVPKLCKAANLT